jgi:hypothetical protein
LAVLLDALEWRGTIVELYLGNNRIGDVGAAALATLVASDKLPTLRTLEVYMNAFGEAGAKSFAAMLQVTTDLEIQSAHKFF